MPQFAHSTAAPTQLRIRPVFHAVLRTTRQLALVLPLLPVVSGLAFAQAPGAAQPAAVPFPEAVANAARILFKALPLPAGDGKVEIVIDPLLDGRTGTHTKAGAQAGQLIAALARREFPRLAIVDFTPEALARRPLLLIGTISLQNVGQDVAAKTQAQNTAVESTPQKPEQTAAAPAVPASYQVWFTAADTQSREVVAKGRAVASAEGVNTAPVPAQGDSPVWLRDPAVQAYLESCEKTKVGEQLAPAYADQIDVSAALAQADQLYGAGQAQKALAIYRAAAALPTGMQLRVLNGIYVSLERLRKKKEMEQAFGDLVDYGLQSQDLAVKILFRPGTTQFLKGREAADYPMWLQQIAAKGAARQSCLEVIGHTSPTGPAALNDRLSQLRAEAIRSTLDKDARGLGNRIIARGVGSRETIVGTGKDDASDALDRRVEFKVIGCS